MNVVTLTSPAPTPATFATTSQPQLRRSTAVTNACRNHRLNINAIVSIRNARA